MQPYVQRHPGNPVIRADDMPFPAQCVFNSGAALYNDRIYMVLSAWSAEWVPQFLVAHSEDGIDFQVEPHNVIVPPAEYPYSPHDGIFDTRITPIDGSYLITYNTYGPGAGGRIRLARTNDFDTFEDMGFITGADHRNCVLFPAQINGQYVRLERPNGEADMGTIFVSYSPDLIYWGNTKLLLQKGTRYWESHKIGAGAPPVKTDRGWLVIYHGCREHMNGIMYNAGCMLLDLNDPSRIIGKMRQCLMWPTEPYELTGNVPGVVFPTAAVPHGQPDELKIYYGAADTAIGLARARISQLVDRCLEDGPIDYKYQY